MNPGSLVSPAASILVFRIGSLGDTVVALPALHAIRRRHGRERIVLLTNSPVDGGLKAASSAQVLAGTGLVDDYIEYPHGSSSPARLWAVVAKIRATRAQRCYFLMPNRSASQARRDRLFLRLAGIRDIVGLDPVRFARKPPQAGKDLWESEAARLMRSIGEDGYVLSASDFSLNLGQQELALAGRELESAGVTDRFIVMSIGAKRRVNDWGDSRWREFLGELARGAGECALVAVGSRSEAERSGRLLAQWPGKSANFCGKLSPRESAAVLSKAALFVGHDSGPMHLASAVKTPLVAVFSARDLPGMWFPFGQERNVFYNAVPCRGCGLEVCVEFQQRCIAEIMPTSVANRSIALLTSEVIGKP